MIDLGQLSNITTAILSSKESGAKYNVFQMQKLDGAAENVEYIMGNNVYSTRADMEFDFTESIQGSKFFDSLSDNVEYEIVATYDSADTITGFYIYNFVTI